MDWNVRPGIGLGDLRFGSSRDAVAGRLGDPDDIDEDLDGPDPHVAWEYENLGLTAYFDGGEDFRLSSLKIESEDAELCGHRLVGQPEALVRAILGGLDLGRSEFELLEFADHPTLGWLRYDEQGLGFWFQDGRLDAIDWGPLIGPDDDFLWPGDAG
ncbi:hypothetical protein TA3x_001850 [Tundrisphaera sp. TA3]|uniref:hypothetical protein n=1 Tax=Tundrisphaera sp. TA3 TaxID=3435775 RepID=UPI003EB9119E